MISTRLKINFLVQAYIILGGLIEYFEMEKIIADAQANRKKKGLLGKLSRSNSSMRRITPMSLSGRPEDASATEEARLLPSSVSDSASLKSTKSTKSKKASPVKIDAEMKSTKIHHCVQMVHTALAIMELLPSLNAVQTHGIKVRIGLHHGTCVAGVIGILRPKCLIYGKDVDYAEGTCFSLFFVVAFGHRRQIS
jgi:hypothetical protein